MAQWNSQGAGSRRIALAATAVLAAVVVAEPAAAQFFGSPYYGQQRSYRPPPPRGFSFPFFDGGGGPFYQPRPFSAPAQPAESYKAPPPRKLETPPTATVLVIGDSMADWLAYGLEEALADTPEIGVVRNIRPTSGLVRYDAKNDSLEWAGITKDYLANEKPGAIVVMLGLNVACRSATSRRPNPARRPKRRTNRKISRRTRRAQPIPRPSRTAPSRRMPPPSRNGKVRPAPTSFTPISGRSFIPSASTT